MLFDTIRRPNAPRTDPKPLLPTEKTADTLETPQQRLERDMMYRFSSKGLELPHESYVAVVQVGKYIFLAIMLPPYLCLYAFPQWLLFQKLPQLVIEVKEAVVAVGKYVSQSAQRVVDVMKGAMKQLIGDALRLMGRGAKGMGELIANGIGAFLNAVAKLARMPAEMLSQLSDAAAGFMKGMLDVTGRWIAEKMASLGDAWGAFAKMMKENIAEPMNQIMQPVLAWAQQVMQRLNQYVESAVDKVKEWGSVAAEKVEKASEHIKMWLSERAEKIVEVMQPVVHFVREVARRVEHAMQWGIDNVAVPVRDAVVSVQAYVVDVSAAGVEAVRALFGGLFAARGAKSGGSLLGRLRGRWERREGSFGGMLKQFYYGGYAGMREIVKVVASGFVVVQLWMVTKLVVLWNGVLAVVRWVVDQLLQLPHRCWMLVKSSWKALVAFVAMLFTVLRVIAVMVWIASKHALYQLQTLRFGRNYTERD